MKITKAHQIETPRVTGHISGHLIVKVHVDDGPRSGPRIRTVTLGGSNPSTEGMEAWENDVASRPNSKPKSPWRPSSATRRWPKLAAKHQLHPNVIAQWKRQARESLPEVFAREPSRGTADHEAEVRRCMKRVRRLMRRMG